MDDWIGGAKKPRGAAGPVRVLAMEDDPSILRFLEIFLEGQGFVVTKAPTGEEGLAAARDLAPDLILLDEVLPDMDGVEVLQRLKNHEATRDVPIVLLATRARDGSEVKSLDSGADDVLTKPFDIWELRRRLDAVMARRQARIEVTEAERLKTVREVVASVAHEVNNPLAAILMCSEALENRHLDDPDVVKKSRLIQENTVRIRDILKRLERVRHVVAKPYVAGVDILDLGGEDEET